MGKILIGGEPGIKGVPMRSDSLNRTASIFTEMGEKNWEQHLLRLKILL